MNWFRDREEAGRRLAVELRLYVDRDTVGALDVSDNELAALASAKRLEVEGRVRSFRRGAPPLDVGGKTALVVDDGVATGGTAHAALETLRARARADRDVRVSLRGRVARGRLTVPLGARASSSLRAAAAVAGTARETSMSRAGSDARGSPRSCSTS